MRRIHERGRELRGAEKNLAATDEFTANHADAEGCTGNQRGRIDKTDKRDRICQSHFSRLIRTGIRDARRGNRDLVLRRNLSRRRIESSQGNRAVRVVTTGRPIHRPSHRLVRRASHSGKELLGIASAYGDRSWRYVDGDLSRRRACAITSANIQYDQGERKRRPATRHESPLFCSIRGPKGRIYPVRRCPSREAIPSHDTTRGVKLVAWSVGRSQER